MDVLSFLLAYRPETRWFREVFRNDSVTTPAGEPEAVYDRDVWGALASRELAITEDLEKNLHLFD